MSLSTVHNILRNRLYIGEFEWHGRCYRGTREPIVARELWDRVQRVLNTRRLRKLRHVKHDLAFSGLITCGHCGCAVIGEIKKGRYVYYRLVVPRICLECGWA